jgi:hypothetical protein
LAGRVKKCDSGQIFLGNALTFGEEYAKHRIDRVLPFWSNAA